MGKALAIITARGGSKRIPRKNIKEFCGKPIIAYSIEAALEAGIFDEVMVSTDDEEIAEIARKYGAEIPFMRSAETSNDFATTADVLEEVLTEYGKCGKEFEYVCCIYPTAPFVTSEKLNNAFELLKGEEVDTVIPVTEFSFPPMRGMYITEEKVHYVFPEYANTRSQDIQTMYHDCGQFCFFRAKRFLEEGKLVTKNTKAMIISGLEVQDIDNETDWKIAEMKYSLMRAGKKDE